jgi:hypothetical protein
MNRSSQMRTKANVNASFLATCGVAEAESMARETELTGMLREIVDVVTFDTAPSHRLDFRLA